MGKTKPQKKPVRIDKKKELADRMRKKLAVKIGAKTVCLTGIVKNESKNMERLLNSLLGIIDMVCLVDTGSEDNTIEVVNNWGKEHNIPTTIHSEPFKNFAYNRTHSVKMAKITYPEADYFLLSDADFVWEINTNGIFDKTLLIDHRYLVEQYNKHIKYWNVRLLSSKVDWECIGLTHEYWTACKKQTEYTGDIRTSKITTLRIDDREDGGCKTDKFERDERLLREGLADEHTSADLKTRYKFYLAQTLKDMGRHNESITWYQERINDKGWEEEVYYSKYQLGVNYESIGWNYKHCITLLKKEEANVTEEDKEFLIKHNPNNLNIEELEQGAKNAFVTAAEKYTESHEYRPVRGEGLYHLAKMYRLLGENKKALEIALKGKGKPYPKEDSLFVEVGCYDYLFDHEISIVAFYVEGKKDLGRQAIGRLLSNPDLPENIRNMAEHNSRHYI